MTESIINILKASQVSQSIMNISKVYCIYAAKYFKFVGRCYESIESIANMQVSIIRKQVTMRNILKV